MTDVKYDWEQIEVERERGVRWKELAERYGAPSANTLRSGYYRWRSWGGGPEPEQGREALVPVREEVKEAEERTVTVSGKTDKRITSLAELFEFFEIPYRWEHGEGWDLPSPYDPHRAGCGCLTGNDAEDCENRVPYSDEYELLSFTINGNSWDVNMKLKGPGGERPVTRTNYKYEVKAYLRPREAVERRDVIEEIWDSFKHDATAHVHTALRTEPRNPRMAGSKALELFLADPHLGMLAWGKEVGVPYDLEIGKQQYRQAFNDLLAEESRYAGIEKIIYVVGNDLFHVDGPGFDAKGNSRGGATTKGTTQDIDTRLARLFTHVRRLIVDCINDAAEIAQVDVVIQPGNHDRHTMYKFGEVLGAWFRRDPDVNVIYSPSVRQYYGYGRNVFMFTHGEEFKRNRDNLATIFATECPGELWVRGRIREIHCAHNHISMEKVWDGRPFDQIWEGRAIRARSLPGLTPEDSWHFEEGYKHGRRATALVWHRDGGLAGLHEFTC